MPLSAGTRLGPYEIVAPLGAGGMGEVYRARDTRLDRTVAVKVLASHMASSAELRQRLEREARAISSLNHPNICTLYDVGQQDGIDFLVMEYLEGETLAKRLEKGQLPLDQALRFATEMADALDKAHRQGVIHRDLKPGNVMLTRTGTKLLDFGLAKAVSPALGDVGATVSRTSPLTVQGTIVGTFQYMSPEQLEGKEADARSDIFVFGAVLHEMITGQKAFEGRSHASLISAVMEREPPPISSLQPMAPPALERLIRVCLAKDPEQRWQTAHDLTLQLEGITLGSQAGAPAQVPVRKSRERLAWIAAAVCLLAALAAGTAYFRRPAPQTRGIRFTIPAPEKTTFGQSLAVSPDGSMLAFVASSEGRTQLWIRRLSSLEAQPLPGTQGATFPFWSPDSRSVAFFAESKLKTININGGLTQTVCAAGDARGGTWSRDDVIVFTNDFGSPLSRVSAQGGQPAPVSQLDGSRQENSHRFPHFLPDGRHFLYLARSNTNRNDAVYAGTLDSTERKLLFAGDSSVGYAPGPSPGAGHLLFVREGTLMAQPFDASRLQLSGEPVVVAPKVGRQGADGPTGYAPFSISQNGVLVYGRVVQTPMELVWYDRSGKRTGESSPAGSYSDPGLSADGKKVVFARVDKSSNDLWVWDHSRGLFSRLTFHPAEETWAVWSPDGSRIVFSSNRSGLFDLYQKAASGAGEEEVFLQDPLGKWPNDWSRDGRWILFETQDPKTKEDLWVLPTFGERKPQPFVQTESYETHGRFSPDGRWVAYASDESGGPEIYVRPFPSAPGKWQVSVAGGSEPAWRGDGKELYYVADEKLMAVAVSSDGGSPGFGPPRLLFPARAPSVVFGFSRNRYQVTKDGQRFLVMTPVEAQETAPLTVVVNWTAEQNRK